MSSGGGPTVVGDDETCAAGHDKETHRANPARDRNEVSDRETCPSSALRSASFATQVVPDYDLWIETMAFEDACTRLCEVVTLIAALGWIGSAVLTVAVAHCVPS